MTGILIKVRAALAQSNYALDRSMQFKTGAGQELLVSHRIKENNEALKELDEFIASVPDNVDRINDRKFILTGDLAKNSASCMTLRCAELLNEALKP